MHQGLECEICGSTSCRVRNFTGKPNLCDRCCKVAGRRFIKFRGKRRREVVIPTRREWLYALKAAWDVNGQAFRCQLTGIKLQTDQIGSPAYLTLDHATPGSAAGGWIVVAALINDMKSDLAVEEFQTLVPLVAKCLVDPDDLNNRDSLEASVSALRHFTRKL